MGAVRVTAEEFAEEAMEGMDSATLGQKHVRAFTWDDGDAVLLAEFDSLLAHRSLAAAAIHPDAANSSLGTILHNCGGDFWRRHQEGRVDRWFDVLNTRKAFATQNDR